MSFQVYVHPILWQGKMKKWGTIRPIKISTLMEMPLTNTKKEVQAFLGIINYLGNFSPRTVVVCKPLCKLTSSKAVWTWNVSYKAIYDKTKLFIKANACMKLYNENKPFYLETDASGEALAPHYYR